MARNRMMRSAPDALPGLAERLHALTEQMLRMEEGENFDSDVAWASGQLDAVRERLSRHARPHVRCGDQRQRGRNSTERHRGALDDRAREAGRFDARPAQEVAKTPPAICIVRFNA